ncbi:MAG: Nramp family divalent metal transporter [Acidobacteria bacterium]|nr:Nramp family divalent metal transporter [Acidobacteriota bacterium]
MRRKSVNRKTANTIVTKPATPSGQASQAAAPQKRKTGLGQKVEHFFKDLGPGLITGAADDDPSGISTYSVTGAAFGYAQLWTVIFSFPLMAAVQLMCARLGLVSGRGLAGVIRQRYPRPVLWFACLLLLIANTVNIGADLGGMAEVMEMMTGVHAVVWLPLFAVLIVVLLIFINYRNIARIFKWLTLVLFSYVIAAFLAHPDWRAVFQSTFIPHIEFSRNYLATFVAIMGTTISPYLFFWQAAQEVEEERKLGRKTVKARRGATLEELSSCRRDVLTGMGFAGVVMYFIILTTGATLHANGQQDIETAKQAAEALRPLAGNAAYLLFTLGLVGTGMLGVPVLAGSAAYAIAEGMHWRGSLDDKPKPAAKFYAVLAIAVIIGLALNFFGVNAVKMLFWAAVINGVLAPPLVIIVTLLTSDKKVMGDKINTPLVRWLGWLAALVMTAGAIAMFIL